MKMFERRSFGSSFGGPALALSLACSCSVEAGEESTGFGDSFEDSDADLDEARDAYILLARTGYDTAFASAEELRAAVETFLANPTAGEMNKTKVAYLTAYTDWMATEALRSYGGPVDGSWGRINAWRMNPEYIDYTSGSGENGIINDPVNYPAIDADVLAFESQAGTQRNVTGGYHAIEFLLWGEDLDAAAAGMRPAEDYTIAANADRRGQYLQAAVDLLLRDLGDLSSQWADNGTYTGQFLAMERNEAFGPMLQGLRHLAGTELGAHFIAAGLAYDPMGSVRFDELSPFSDRTPVALKATIGSLANVYRGQLGETDFIGLEVAVAARDSGLDARVQSALDDLIAAADAIEGPYETSVLPGGPDRANLQALENQLWAFGLLLEEVGPLFMVEVPFGDDGDDGAPTVALDMMN